MFWLSSNMPIYYVPGNHIYVFSSLPLMYLADISFSLFMPIYFNIIHTCVSSHNTNAYYVLSNIYKYFSFGGHICSFMFVVTYVCFDWKTLRGIAICMHVCMYVCMSVCVCIYVCVCTYVHTYIHTSYIHAALTISIHLCICCKGVVFQTITSFVRTQGTSLQTTEKTVNDTFLDIYLVNLICRR